MKDKIQHITKKYNIQLLLTFGSYNTREFTDKSDIDVGFISNELLSLNKQLELLEDVMDYFEMARIDLIDLSKATPLLLYEVACNSKVLYEECDSYIKFRLKASARYADTKHLRVSRRKYLNETLDIFKEKSI